MKIKNRNKSFTLVELIIVIAIIAILAVISVLTVSEWTGKSRDARRLSDLTQIQKALDLSLIKNTTYPSPDGTLTTSTYKGVTISKTGEFGDGTVSKTSLKTTPKDPLTNSNYSYGITDDGLYYQLATVLENSKVLSTYSQTAYAGNITAKVVGNFNGFVLVQSGTSQLLVSTPSLLVSGTGNQIDLGVHDTYFVVDGKENLPYSANGLNGKAIKGSLVSNNPIGVKSIDVSAIKSNAEIETILNDFGVIGSQRQVIKSNIENVVSSKIPLSITPKDYQLNLSKVITFAGTGSEQPTKIFKIGTNYYIISNTDGSFANYSSIGGSAPVGGYDAIIIKTDQDFNPVAMKLIGGAGTDNFADAIVDGNDIILAGTTASNLSSYTGGSAGSGGNDFLIARMDKDLNLISLKNFGGTGNDWFNKITKYNGKFYLLGRTASDLTSLGAGPFAGGQDNVLFELSDDFSINKVIEWGADGIDICSSLSFIGGKIIVAGYTVGNQTNLASVGGTSGGTDNDMAIYTLNFDLKLEKVQRYGGTGNDTISSIVSNNGKLYAFGSTSSNVPTYSSVGRTGLSGASDFIILELNNDFSINKVKLIGGSGGEYGNSLSIVDNKIYIIGDTDSNWDNYSSIGGKTSAGMFDNILLQLDLDYTIKKVLNWGGTQDDFPIKTGITFEGDRLIINATSKGDLTSIGGLPNMGVYDMVLYILK